MLSGAFVVGLGSQLLPPSPLGTDALLLVYAAAAVAIWWLSGRPGWGLAHAAAVAVGALSAFALVAFRTDPIGHVTDAEKLGHNDRPAPSSSTPSGVLPVDAAHRASLARARRTTDIPDPTLPGGLALPQAGEAAAPRRWRGLPGQRVAGYDDDRDRPGVDVTSRMSVHLKWGEIHPRTMLADLAPLRSAGAATYRKELAWREFYADVLFQRPRDRARLCGRAFARMCVRRARRSARAWQRGPHRLPDRGRGDAPAPGAPAGCTTGCG